MQNIGYIMAGCEFIGLEIINRIDELRKQYNIVGIGVYSDEYFEKINGRKPIRPYTERYRVASTVKYVDFVFEVNAENAGSSEITRTEDPVYEEDLSEKNWHIIYAPGTYDLFHEGHLQHLLEVRSKCDILVVGVNSDDLVFKNKGKHSRMTQEERMEVVRNLKFVDYVYLVESNDKSLANKWVKEHTGSPISAIFMGSDLQNSNLAENPEKIPMLFTERDPILMAKRSSSYYRRELEKFQNE